MSDPSDEAQAERLRRLAERRAPRATPPPTTAPKPGRRRHAAAAARLLAAGLSGSSFLFGVAALAAKPPAWVKTESAGTGAVPTTVPTPAPTQPVTPVTVVVVERVHRPVYVDQHGNPVNPNSLTVAGSPAAAVPAPRPTTAPAGRAPVVGGAVPPPTTATPAPAAKPPSGSSPAPLPAGIPTPAPTSATTTPTTVATTTTTTAPPPPPAPACTGSKCP